MGSEQCFDLFQFAISRLAHLYFFYWNNILWKLDFPPVTFNENILWLSKKKILNGSSELHLTSLYLSAWGEPRTHVEILHKDPLIFCCLEFFILIRNGSSLDIWLFSFPHTPSQHTHMRLSLCIQKPYWTANLLINFPQIWKGIYIFYPKSNLS